MCDAYYISVLATVENFYLLQISMSVRIMLMSVVKTVTVTTLLKAMSVCVMMDLRRTNMTVVLVSRCFQ